MPLLFSSDFQTIFRVGLSAHAEKPLNGIVCPARTRETGPRIGATAATVLQGDAIRLNDTTDGGSNTPCRSSRRVAIIFFNPIAYLVYAYIALYFYLKYLERIAL